MKEICTLYRLVKNIIRKVVDLMIGYIRISLTKLSKMLNPHLERFLKDHCRKLGVAEKEMGVAKTLPTCTWKRQRHGAC